MKEHQFSKAIEKAKEDKEGLGKATEEGEKAQQQQQQQQYEYVITKSLKNWSSKP